MVTTVASGSMILAGGYAGLLPATDAIVVGVVVVVVVVVGVAAVVDLVVVGSVVVVVKLSGVVEGSLSLSALEFEFPFWPIKRSSCSLTVCFWFIIILMSESMGTAMAVSPSIVPLV